MELLESVGVSFITNHKAFLLCKVSTSFIARETPDPKLSLSKAKINAAIMILCMIRRLFQFRDTIFVLLRQASWFWGDCSSSSSRKWRFSSSTLASLNIMEGSITRYESISREAKWYIKEE